MNTECTYPRGLLLARVIHSLLVMSVCAQGVCAAELPVAEQAFAALGIAEHAVSGNTLNVIQHTDRAILDWQSFNVSRDGAVRFRQPSASAIALNRIHQADPSRILGTVSANGQIYLVNQNGFLFGKDAKVDANSLVVSTLQISDDTFQRGLTKVIDQDGRPTLTSDGTVFRTGVDGKPEKIAIEVAAGAKIDAAASGRIVMAAPAIRNQGSVSAPDGQVVLAAASDKVYLQEVSGDPALRGLLVEVGSGGEVANLGKLLADRGNVTLVGFAVNQQGRISAKTAVRANGSIKLLAREGAAVRRESDRWVLEAKQSIRAQDTGDGLGTRASVILGEGSLTQASPDLKDKATAVDSQTQEASRVDIMGNRVELCAGSLLRARSGQVNITATEHPDLPGAEGVRNESRLIIDQGARIDVSGLKRVSLPMERNVVKVELRNNELRDSPLQKSGILNGRTVSVDIRKGTPIGDISGALERIGRTVRERSTAGGSLKLGSEGDVLLQQGSLLDFSGGSLLYRPGYIKTTQLIQDRHTVDIGEASPDVRYDGILGDIEKTYRAWHFTRRWEVPGAGGQGRFEAGYVEGKGAGSLSIAANVLELEGGLKGGAVSGLHQRQAEQYVPGGNLSIDLARTPDSTQPVQLGGVADASASQPTLVLGADFMPAAGLGKASIASGGVVTVPADVTVQVPGSGSLALRGGEVKMDGGIRGAAASVELSTRLTSSTQGRLSGGVDLGPTALIDVAGQWVNDLPDPQARPYLGPVFRDGGSVQVTAEGDVSMKAGSRVDVSGGGWRAVDGQVTAGNAGSVTLAAEAPAGSNLRLDGQLQGYALGGGQGGTLSLASARVDIGEGDTAGAGLRLASGFFSQGGFQTFQVSSNRSGITVQAGTQVSPVVANRELDPGFTRQRTGAALARFSHVETLQEAARQPAKLTLTLARTNGDGGPDAAIRLEPGAQIRTDARGAVSLVSDTSLFLEGSIIAPAGNIALQVTPPFGTDPGFLAGQGIWLGTGASLAAPGQALLMNDPAGLITGDVLDGGTVSLRADRGFVNLLPGSVIDVSGTAARVDVASQGVAGGVLPVRRLVPSNGGSIELRAAEGMQLQGTLRAAPGPVAGAAGGSLSIELNKLTRSEPDPLSTGQQPFPDAPSVIRVNGMQVTDRPVDLSLGKALPASEFGIATLSQSQVEEGRFANLSVTTPGRIELQGDLVLQTQRSIRLDSPVLQARPQGGRASAELDSAYIALGSRQTRPGDGVAVTGSGSLTANAGLIDLVGTTVLSGFGKADLASTGDIRLEGIRTTQEQRDLTGEYLMAGDLSLAADQVYPTTLSDFRIALENAPTAALRIAPGDGPSPVFSAGGYLRMEAPVIEQGGVLKVPLGSLSLTAATQLDMLPGSLTTNAGGGALIPFGRTQGGLDWVYPLGTQKLVYASRAEGTSLAPPDKQLNLSAGAVQLEAGAKIDSSGGGDLFAFEFVPGIGGSKDVLESDASAPKFAVLPGFQGNAAPTDPLELPTSGLQVGDSVHLASGGGLPSGDYVLLPAHYALLPGAFLVTQQAGTRDFGPGNRFRNDLGNVVIAGYRSVAGTPLRDARWSGFAVTPRSAVRARAQYDLATGNAFFSAQAERKKQAVAQLPQDAGSLVIDAQSALALAGDVVATAVKNGRAGALDIAAQRIEIVADAAPGGAGQVRLSAADLDRLQVGSVLIGGVRSVGENATNIATRAQNITVAQDAALAAPELILTAQDGIQVGEGAHLSGTGKAVVQTVKPLHIEGDSALLRVSAGPQAEVQRQGGDGTRGSLQVAAGAVLEADGSMNLDASAESSFQGQLAMKGGSLQVTAPHVALGEANGRTQGLLLSASQLNALNLDSLVLGSPNPVGVEGSFELNLGSLDWRSAGVAGHGAAGDVAQISADTLSLSNPYAASAEAGHGNGVLQLRAQRFVLGAGAYRVDGFSSADVQAAGQIAGSGAGSLQSTVDLSFTAPVWTSGPGANTQIQASGHAVSVARSGEASPAAPALGGRLDIAAGNLAFSGNVRLPSGQVRLSVERGNLSLDAGTRIDVSGRAVGADAVLSDGGSIALSAAAGDVFLNPSASLELGGSRGGGLEVQASGRVELAGSMNAAGSNAPGSFSLDQGTAKAGDAWSALFNQLVASGFGDTLDLRVRQGDLVVAAGQRLAGHDISLAADAGDVRIGGTVAAQGSGARVLLDAGDRLELASTAQVTARGTGGKAGLLWLQATDGDGDGNAGVDIASGAALDASPGDAGTAAGAVQLAALRSTDDVAVSGDLRSAVKAGQVTVEAVRTEVHEGTITAAETAAWETDTAAFMTHADAIESRLGIPGGLRPGLTVQSPGDLVLGAQGWDLSGQRYGGRPGVLVLEAAGDLRFDGSLSDGILSYDPSGIDVSALLGAGTFIPVKDQLMSDRSWGYRLVAGKDVSLASGALVRTGTGDIDVQAGRDFVLADDTSALYTAGRAETQARYGSLKPSFVAFGFYGEYPVEGGSIRINAGRDLVGAATGQFFNDWFVETGNWSRNPTHTGETPTAWALALGAADIRFDGQPLANSRFRQNLGALGGGDVDLRAGRDVHDLSVMLPTTGKQLGQQARPEVPSDSNFLSNQVQVGGGGDLTLTAGGDVRGGTFYVGRGSATLRAGGALSTDEAGLGSVLALGESHFDVQAVGDVAIGAVLNPTVIAGGRNASYFFTYSADSQLKLDSVAGDVRLQNDVNGLVSALNARRASSESLDLPGAALRAFAVYPGSLEVSAPQGSIGIEHSLVTLPSAQGRFALEAGGNLTTGNAGVNVTVLQSDADPTLLPSVAFPARSFLDASQRLDPFGAASLIHATSPLHGSTAEPATLRAGGNILAQDPLLFSFASPAEVTAGGNLRDVSFKLQHAGYRLSTFDMGGDLSFTTPRAAAGNLLNLVRGIELSGPGELWINAGGSVDLGTSQGIYTLGNTFNTALPDEGASISILVGVKSPPDFDAFAKAYDPTATINRAALTAFLRRRGGDGTLSETDAPAVYAGLAPTEQREFLFGLFFTQLSDAAKKAAVSGLKKDYEPGFAAADRLFPGGADFKGDVSLVFSRIQTVDGGDINLLVPGGEVNAGLAVSFSGAKPTSQLGIVTQRDGAINAFVDRDFQVNQSRVFALDGGDITVWSSNGNIDAGRGAKSAIAAPPPIISFDAQGNLRIEYPPVVSGSGIRTAATTTGRDPGDVVLAAPRGVVDAAEAGIGGNNVTIAANAIIGASNIDVGGVASGLPTVNVAVPALPAGAESAAASAAQAAQQSTAQADSNSATNPVSASNSSLLRPLQVDVLGFGDCSIRDVREGKPGCG
ncbi:filamentous haemagglutinin family protein [Methyloterricola oryzae]|uniref:filamentous haemagglutinin family protein n=1 Tax=Methyloterricola oryzae TaxID=1495050 RepID=UPI0005EAD5F8|nr:filamentous haemagglutinin family protein [Methyloterricola oryzae]